MTYRAPDEVHETAKFISLFVTLASRAALLFITDLAGTALKMAIARALEEYKKSKRNAEIELETQSYDDIRKDWYDSYNLNHRWEGEPELPEDFYSILDVEGFQLVRTHQNDNQDVGVRSPSFNWMTGGGVFNANLLFHDDDEYTVTYRYYFDGLEGARDANNWHEVRGLWINGTHFNFNAADEFEHPDFYPFTVAVRAYGPYGRYLGEKRFTFTEDESLDEYTKWTSISDGPKKAWDGKRFGYNLEVEMDVTAAQVENLLRYYSVSFFTNPFGNLNRIDHVNEGRHEEPVALSNTAWMTPDSLYQSAVQFNEFSRWVDAMSANWRVPDSIFNPRYDLQQQARPLFDGIKALSHQDSPRMLGKAKANGLTFDYDTGMLSGVANSQTLVVIRMWDVNDVVILQREALNGPALVKHDAEPVTSWVMAYQGEELPELEHFYYDPAIPDII